jgi:2-polyprenyl-6-methoxyphenol hydroxylase-like FAD-dependent oxidoreductase
MNMQYDVLIVGGGPSGIAAAIECQRAKLRYRLIDQRTEPTQWSQALVVQARTLEQFERYGIAQKLVDQGHKVRHTHILMDGHRHGPLTWQGIPGRFSFALFVPQRETERVLLEALQALGGRVERNMRLDSCTDMWNFVRSTIVDGAGNQEHIQSRRVIACDGAHSRVRDSAGISFVGSEVPMHFYLSDSVITGADRPVDDITICMSKNEFAFLAPVTETETRLIYGTHDMNTPQEALSDEEMQQCINRAAHGALDVNIHSSSWRSPFHVNEREVETFRHGNLFFAGDAAHIHSPVFGQGMNTGLQDVANLVWKIAAVQTGADEDLLDSYHDERQPVAHGVIGASSRVLSVGTSSNPALTLLRDVGSELMARLPVMQKQIATFLSETAISYRHSEANLDAGGSGKLHVGDRAPDADFQIGDASHTVLSPGDFSGHIFLDCDASCETPEDRRVEAIRFIRLDADRLHGEGRGEYHNGMRYCIRPDGYIGYRGPLRAEAELHMYRAKMGLASTGS